MRSTEIRKAAVQSRSGSFGKRIAIAALVSSGLLTLSAIPAGAQPGVNANLTGTGATNFIPIWTNSTTLGKSTLFQNGGNLGIGNTSPAFTLDVSGSAIIRGTFQPASHRHSHLRGRI